MTATNERRTLPLSDEQIEELAHLLTNKISEQIAEKTAEKAVELIQLQMYQEAGKTVFKGAKAIGGILLLGVLYWMGQRGLIKI